MQVLIFSDLHAHVWPDFADTVIQKNGSAINSRLLDAVKVVSRITKYCEAEGIKVVLFAGDLFHRQQLIDVAVFNAVAGSLRPLARVADVYLLAGNHDLVKRSGASFTSEHALYALGQGNIKVIDRPSIILDCIGMIPYSSERDTILKAIDSVERRGAQMMIMHAGVNGAVTGPLEVQPLEPITMDDLPKMTVYCGHYHKPQVLPGKGGCRVIYIGSPLELRRGDGHVDLRGFLTVNLNRPERCNRVVYKGPQFVTTLSSNFDVKNCSGNFVDLLWDGGSNYMSEILKQQLLEAGARAVNVIVLPQPDATPTARSKLRNIDGKLPSIAETCAAYVTKADTNLDKRRLLEIANKALQAVETTGK